MSNGEKYVEANGARLCVETFGDPRSPAVLLIHGASASMLWWEADLCQQIASCGRYVIRYDNRDTGKSSSYPVGQPPYKLTDLATDAVGILDALQIEQAHIVGCSMAGAITAVLGLDHRKRVASLTFLSTTCGGSDLPGMSQEFLNYTNVTPDLSNPTAVVEHIVEFARICSGGSPLFNEGETRLLVEQDVARTQDIAAALTNHFLMEFDGPRSGTLSDINVPTLVVHGELDPVFPLPHGEALRNTIPGATLLVLPQTGHELPRPVWPKFVEGLIRHTR